MKISHQSFFLLATAIMAVAVGGDSSKDLIQNPADQQQQNADLMRQLGTSFVS
jgi:hypothetical protein